MELLDTLTIHDSTTARTIELYCGDLTELKPEDAVDILVVSAFRGNYYPLETSLVGALYRKGISVEKLAASKYLDLRETSSCWLSQEIASQTPGIQFKHILCFEPIEPQKAPQIVGDIFRCLMAFLGGNTTNSTIAMPLVASGTMKASPSEMLASILDAAVHWMALGIPLKQLKIVVYLPEQATQLKPEFSRLKQKYETSILQSNRGFKYDVFISYSHKNIDKVLLLIDELKKMRPNLRIFFDRSELNPGAAWQQEIYEALDNCRKVIAVLSPYYLSSKVCLEEYHIAWFRHRESKEKIMFAILLYDVKLPTYIKALLQYRDCREGDDEKLRSACRDFLSMLDA